MFGAICGDIIGSTYEQKNIKTKVFPLFSKDCTFTDDTVLTLAVADCLLHNRPFSETIRRFYHLYPKAGFGYMFSHWARSENMSAYNSYGNGSAMRVSPIAWAENTLEGVLSKAKESADVTHNHPEGVKGAQAIAASIFLARMNGSKAEIKKYVLETFKYDLNITLDEIRPDYHFDATCQNSVPQAIIAFLESDGFEDAIRNAVSIGGDSDTIACMTGSIAEAFYGGVPQHIRTQALGFLGERLRGISSLFEEKYLSHLYG